jgi:opacity protein-like surface antigen
MISPIINKGTYMKKILQALLLALPVIAIAAESQGSYVGVEVGYTRIDDAAQQTANDLVRSLGGVATVSADAGVGLGKLFAGYKFNENIGAEIGAYRTSDFDMKASGITGGSASYVGTSSTNVYGAEASLLLRPSVSTGLNGLFVRFGGHWDRAEQDASIAGGVNGYATSWRSGTGFLAGAGYDINVDKNIAGRIGYTYLDSIAGSNAYANVGSLSLMYKF